MLAVNLNKLMKKLLLPLAMVFVLGGCASYQYTARTVGVGTQPIGAKEVVAEVVPNYDRVVSASSRYQVSSAAAIEEAEYRCIIDNNIDVVVDPVIKVERLPLLSPKKYRATITGFAGQFKPAKAGVDAVKDYNKEDVEKYMLLTDLEFAKLYYSKDKGTSSVGDVYYINTSGSSDKKGLSASTKSKSASQVSVSGLFNKKKADKKKSDTKKSDKKKSKKFSGIFSGASADGAELQLNF